MFKGKKGQALATDIGKKSKTFVPGENLPEKPMGGPSKEDVAAIKVWFSLHITYQLHESLQTLQIFIDLIVSDV